MFFLKAKQIGSEMRFFEIQTSMLLKSIEKKIGIQIFMYVLKVDPKISHKSFGCGSKSYEGDCPHNNTCEFTPHHNL